MSEETPGFDEKPEVPADGTSDDAAEPKAAASSDKEEAAAPAGDSAAADVALLAQLDQARTALGERTADLQ
ncbi:nucleotide exchange factor GrpE, partial [Streptomyces sp. NPDC059981]